MCEWLWLWLVALVLGVWLWLTGGELWSGVRGSGDERLAARVVLFGGILMVLTVPLTLAGSGTGG